MLLEEEIRGLVASEQQALRGTGELVQDISGTGELVQDISGMGQEIEEDFAAEENGDSEENPWL